MSVSRRHFTKLTAVGLAAEASVHAAEPLLARMVVERLQSALGGDWPTSGVDGVKVGNLDTPVHGIATTAMATVDVLKQAIERQCNFVITYEPTFFSRQDGQPSSAPVVGAPGRRPPGVPADDPILMAKKQFIEKHGVVVFRLQDHWQSRKQGEMTTGLGDALGWSKYRIPSQADLYDIPPASAEQVVAGIRKRLRLRGGLRAVGDRHATVRRVLLQPGFLSASVFWDRYDEADLVITGEVREWENTFFAADLLTAGEKRGLVTLGRVVSEDPGMRLCAAWLKGLVGTAPVQWIPAGDLYWRAS